MNEIELKPCPFCGGDGYITLVSKTAGAYLGATFEVGCRKCKFSFKEESIWNIVNGQIVTTQNGYNACVRRWNRRATDGKAD